MLVPRPREDSVLFLARGPDGSAKRECDLHAVEALTARRALSLSRRRAISQSAAGPRAVLAGREFARGQERARQDQRARGVVFACRLSLVSWRQESRPHSRGRGGG